MIYFGPLFLIYLSLNELCTYTCIYAHTLSHTRVSSVSEKML